MQKELELRMYFLTMYNISKIAQGIQCGHAVEEYSDKYGTTKEYKKYRKYKTWIILNGGTSNSGKESYYTLQPELGSMEQHLQLLKDNDINCAPFYEPDLNYCLSAIAFIVDERVFDRKIYISLKDYIIQDCIKKNESTANVLNPTNEIIQFRILNKNNDDLKLEYLELYTEWLKYIGGKRNEFLREFLRDKKLA